MYDPELVHGLLADLRPSLLNFLEHSCDNWTFRVTLGGRRHRLIAHQPPRTTIILDIPTLHLRKVQRLEEAIRTGASYSLDLGPTQSLDYTPDNPTTITFRIHGTISTSLTFPLCNQLIAALHEMSF